MCGIAGIVELRGRAVRREDIDRLTDLLSHRGPDGRGIWIDRSGTVALGHRRLAIIDTSDAGQQPMLGVGGRHVIVYNGEVYNFVELRAELESLGEHFATRSDTEVILSAWARWGTDMLPRFNGMWALAIHDTISGATFLARDRFGIKPLLYALTPERLVFASEMNALRESGLVDAAPDLDVARRLLLDPFGVEGSERTLLAAVRRLPAGHWARLTRDHLQIRRWWRSTDHLETPPATPAARAARFRELFVDSVRMRMRADVPIGTCLSGGFDSSAVVGTMSEVARAIGGGARFTSSWRHAFIASFPGQDNDETPQALEAAAFAHVEPRTLAVTDADSISDLDRVLHDIDDVYIGLPTAPWLIYRELRRHRVVVSLDGHGADELMGAYRQAGAGFAFGIRNALAALASRSSALARAVDVARAAGLAAQGYGLLRGGLAALPPMLRAPVDADPLPVEWGPLNRRLYRMFHATVLPTILRNFDRLSMAHGIEIRMPFMDWRLVCFTLSLPDSEKMSGELTKVIARRSLAGMLPDSIRNSPRKVGFNSPMPGWLNGPLQPWTLALLNARCDPFDAIVDSRRLDALVRAHNDRAEWDWASAGRLWPYLHMKWWLLNERGVMT